MGFAYEVKGIEACIGEGVVEAPRMAEAKASRNTGLGNGRRARATGEEQQKSSLGWQQFAHVGENLKFILWVRGLKLVGLWPHLANICLLCV